MAPKPCLLGRKLHQTYYKGTHHIEVCVDLSSNVIAKNVVCMLLPMTKILVLDIGLVLQGHSEAELPEHLLGTARLSRFDMTSATKLQEH